jgi:CheY-like chemotaxis protein
LVVEDDAAVRQTAVDMLRQLGYQVATAEGAEQALTLLKGGMKVDMLFTDVVMPGPVGSRDLARQAVALLPGLFVLYTSGYTENAIIHHGRLDPGVHLLSKPYGIEELGRKLRLVFAGAPGDASNANVTGEEPPRQPAALSETSAVAEPPAPTAGGPRHVVLVEDDALVAMSTMDMLAQLGVAAEQAATGTEALEIVRRNSGLTTVIADIGLPDMDGHKLVEEIRALRPGIRVIMATGAVPDDATTRAGTVSYLAKPYQLADLKRALDGAAG